MRPSAIAVAAGTLLALAAAPAGASTKCNLGSAGEKLGPTYVTSLSVSGVGCASGEKLVSAYYRCRLRNGGVKGTCKGSVLGYRCRESRSGIAIQFDAKVSCTSGSRRVDHTYTQDT